MLEAGGLVEVQHTGRGGINQVRITEAGLALYKKLRQRELAPRRDRRTQQRELRAVVTGLIKELSAE